jgi:hypothetical protein
MVVITPNSMSKFEIGFLEHHLRYSRKSMNLPCAEIYGVGGVEFFFGSTVLQTAPTLDPGAPYASL